jgi:sugar lactone lactonase YvrE
VTAVLGEGPYWDPAQSCLLWVDIPAGLLHITRIPSGETSTVEMGEVSAAFPARDGGLVYAGGHRVILREHAGQAMLPGGRRELGKYQEHCLAAAPPADGVRFNDGGVDPAGRVWIGSMDTSESKPLGTLYRLDAVPPGPGRAQAPAVLTPVAPGATISNGLGWSPDGSRMYYVDSPTRRVDVFDYDLAAGVPSGRRVFADLSGARGVPDGLTVDHDGCVWVAMWDGWAVRRHAPTGEPDAVVAMPVARPTSLAFAGEGMADLYVTTARIGLSPAEQEAQPLAGRLLRLRPGPVGLPATATQALLPPEPAAAATGTPSQ